ncbi:hypothetical protein [Rhodovibrio sodomensis]|uniref:hypothetical protein n=1 Tax=Rhodovibrio sodomensis TaxID=1088 RepID=UPI0019041F6F|nr:hypothetical protein [Rhodovibrio sodomensis]
MRPTAAARHIVSRAEAGLAARFGMRRREVRDWVKLGGLATVMAAVTAMSRVVIG